jgi:hypothetical protein
MFRESSGTWRLRSRSRHFTVDVGCGTSDLAAAKRIAKDHLDGRAKDQQPQGSETLEQVVKAYATMPKRCAERAATDNVQRLRSIVRLAWGRELAQVKLSDLSPKLWRDFMAEKLGGTLDLATRRPGNAAINAAVRSAASIFIMGTWILKLAARGQRGRAKFWFRSCPSSRQRVNAFSSRGTGNIHCFRGAEQGGQ